MCFRAANLCGLRPVRTEFAKRISVRDIIGQLLLWFPASLVRTLSPGASEKDALRRTQNPSRKMACPDEPDETKNATKNPALWHRSFSPAAAHFLE
jgi:hypothetical protein